MFVQGMNVGRIVKCYFLSRDLWRIFLKLDGGRGIPPLCPPQILKALDSIQLRLMSATSPINAPPINNPVPNATLNVHIAKKKPSNMGIYLKVLLGRAQI